MPEATLHDGTTIGIHVLGSGPNVLLPLFPHEWAIADGLSDRYRVVVMDYYAGHLQAHPDPESLTPDNVGRDLLAIADAAEAETFAWWGYSWTAVIGQQLALRTDRLTALIMGGFPPIDGPYRQMLQICETLSTRGGSIYGLPRVEPTDAARQFETYYRPLQDFDDRAAQARITCPRLAYIGSIDRPTLDGELLIDMGATVERNRAELERLGWEVQIVPGKNHMDFAPEETLAIVSEFLDRRLLGGAAEH
jgi:pimeloyl-ACP methyl ester carboxylesterase